MNTMPARADLQRAEHERDLFRALLELAQEPEVERFLEATLAALVERTGADSGFLEIAESHEHQDRRFSIARGYSPEQVEDVRKTVSEGIVAETLLVGKIVQTTSAVDDPRFMSRESVRAAQIEAVCCAPVRGERCRGFVYLQAASGGARFPQEDLAVIEAFSQFLGPIADRVLLEHRVRESEDHTRQPRELLRCDSVLGRSRALANTLRDLAAAAPIDIHVLLTGESGTGKSLVARVLHESGPRSGQPFVELNCAAIPPDLLENELFGHEAGAFTGASRASAGKVGAAERGTLFLDEIAELPPSSQAKLLQLLQSRTYYRLGSTTPSQADVRIVAATNADLTQAVESGGFRQDLLYRLQVLPIRLPSLAERREDLPELVDAFLSAASRKHALPALPISPSGLAAIEIAEWPGNVRQLESVVTAGLVRAASVTAREVSREHLFPDGQEGRADERAPSFQEATRSFQSQLLARTLRDCAWNVTEAARRLDLSRSHAYNLIDAFGLTRGD